METTICPKCKEEIPDVLEELWDFEHDMCQACADYYADREPDYDSMREGK